MDRGSSNRALARQLGGERDGGAPGREGRPNPPRGGRRLGPRAGEGALGSQYRSGSATAAAWRDEAVPEALGAVRDTLREHGEPVAAGVMTFMQARTANEVLKAQERRVRLAADRPRALCA